MEISNQGTNQGSWYVNPNNRTLTSNRKNTAIKNRDTFDCMQRLLNPVEDRIKAMKTPINLADRTTINRATNTATIAAGTRITVNDGYVLTVTERGVECHHGAIYNPYDTKAYEKAEGLAGSLTVLLRNAGGTQNITAFSEEGYQKWTSDVSEVLSYLGLDGSRNFTVNGMKYSKNGNGYWESEANSMANAAYERQRANNRTYTFADERTKNQVTYISDYYLGHTSDEMQAAWQKALEKTGVNPFPEDFSSTLSQLSMEQDFATGGDDDIFGNDKESNIAAVQSILDRIDNPLGKVSEKDESFRADEKVFYTAVLEYLTASDVEETVITNIPDDISGGSTAPDDKAQASGASKVSAATDISNVTAASDKTKVSGGKQPYTAYESANYKIEPDNENNCFTIYNGQGERLGVFFYSDIKIKQDAASGKQFLISENGTMWYDVLVMDQELKEDLKHVMGVDALETEPLRGYAIKTHAGTGIQYVIKDGEEGRGGRVLLQNEADREKYEALAETYFNKYPNLIESKEEAYIWASFEIEGMAMRTEQGIISLHYDGMSYNDNSNPLNSWSIRFWDDTYQKIFEWLDRNNISEEEKEKFSTWQDILDKIGSNYERILPEREENISETADITFKRANAAPRADDVVKSTTENRATENIAAGKEVTENRTTRNKVEEYAEKAFNSVGSKAPKEVKDAWMDAARETGVNGLGIGSNGMMSHISQLMVQRLKRIMMGDGADPNDILGNSISSAIRAIEQALYDLDHPLVPNNTRSIEVQRQRAKEKEFYQVFLRNLGTEAVL